MDNQSVVIYRSQFEADSDKFLHDNPEYFIYILAGVILLLISRGVIMRIMKRRK